MDIDKILDDLNPKSTRKPKKPGMKQIFQMPRLKKVVSKLKSKMK